MAKRVATSSVNWNKISQIVSDENAVMFSAFKSKSDKFLRTVNSLPPELPKIDWTYYKSKIALPGMVDSLKNGYESVKIPYPADQGFLAKVDNQDAQFKKQYKEIIDKLNIEKEQLTKDLKKLEAIGRHSDMCIEEFYLTCPDKAFDPKAPRLWPQNVKD